MTGKHVKPVQAGETQPTRSGLAVGLTILTALLCIAVLFLSARRHRDQLIRERIEARMVDLDGYNAAGVPVQILNPGSVDLDQARKVGPIIIRPPSDAWSLGESVIPYGETRYRVGAIANGTLRAEYLQPVSGEWQTGLRRAIEMSPYLEPPRRRDDRALVDYLFSYGVDVVRDCVARPRQPVIIAQRAFETLRVRYESQQLGRGRWLAPRPFSLPGVNGYVDLATAERPVVLALVFQSNSVITEAVISRMDGHSDGQGLAELNDRWWTMIVGIEGPAPAEPVDVQ